MLPNRCKIHLGYQVVIEDLKSLDFNGICITCCIVNRVDTWSCCLENITIEHS